jgi:hypothetical protein
MSDVVLAVLDQQMDELITAIDKRKEELAAQELPEVWYSNSISGSYWHFKAGEDGSDGSYTSNSGGGTGRSRHSLDGQDGIDKTSEADCRNAYALKHGADFTGRLDKINVPVCELNKATRDEIDAHKWDEFEMMTERGEWIPCLGDVSFSCISEYMRSNEPAIYRLRAPKQDAADRAICAVIEAMGNGCVTEAPLAAIIREAYAKDA